MKNVMRPVLPVFACAAALCSCAAREEVRVREVLGTVCSINAYDDGTAALHDELFSRLEEIESRFSVNVPTSDIRRINDAAGKAAVTVHDDVFLVLEQALRYAELSDGAFDPTVGPLVALWGINTDHARVPSAEEIEAARALVDWRDVELSGGGTEPCTVRLAREGMRLDLGGIAKGYAADEMARILSRHKVRRAMINLGGNVYAFGTKKDGSAWKIGIKNPDDSGGDPLLVLSVTGGTSVVTSGGYERYFEQDGTVYHHILNPHTGFPADELCRSVTIVSSSSMQADALSTIAFILGADAFGSLLGQQDVQNVQAVFIDRARNVTASRSLDGMLSVYGAYETDIMFMPE